MGIELIKEYLNLKNKFSVEFAKKVVADMWKQYVDIDKATVEVGKNSVSIDESFTFHIVDREQVEMECDITNHYVDTNRPVQDHIAWKPLKITLQGKIGEYFNSIAENMEHSHSVAYYQVMGVINSYLPKNTDFAVIRKLKSAVSRLTGGNKIINTIANTLTSEAYGVLLNAIKQLNYDLITPFQEQVQIERANQTQAYLTLQGLWMAGLPVRVKTSWQEYDNMIITSVKPLRDNNADITEFTVSFQKLNTTVSLVTDIKIAKERTAQQKSEPVNNGKTSGVSFDLDYAKSLPKVTPI